MQQIKRVYMKQEKKREHSVHSEVVIDQLIDSLFNQEAESTE